ncbi:hypothetical protein FRX31_028494, partial [Thalictrum thalictroides]
MHFSDKFCFHSYRPYYRSYILFYGKKRSIQYRGKDLQVKFHEVWVKSYAKKLEDYVKMRAGKMSLYMCVCVCVQENSDKFISVFLMAFTVYMKTQINLEKNVIIYIF